MQQATDAGIELVKVKRDGPRGWHWIEARRFDPAVHELHEDQPRETTAEPQPAPRRRGRSPTP